MGVDLGWFTNLTQDPDHLKAIDWTQLDQFTCWYGRDTNLAMFDTTILGLILAPEEALDVHSDAN